MLGPNAPESPPVKIHTLRGRLGPASVAGIDVTLDGTGSAGPSGSLSQNQQRTRWPPDARNLVLAPHPGPAAGATHTRGPKLFDRFGLTDAAGPSSCGRIPRMARKLDVAIGLIHRPRVLFLDEPDDRPRPRRPRADMWAEIARLSAEEQLTVLLTTHYLDEADHLGRPAGHRRSGPCRRRGHARRAQRASCAVTPSTSSSTTRSDGRGERFGRADARARRHRRQASACGPAPISGARRPGLLSTLATGRRRGVRHRRPALAGRRLPAHVGRRFEGDHS